VYMRTAVTPTIRQHYQSLQYIYIYIYIEYRCMLIYMMNNQDALQEARVLQCAAVCCSAQQCVAARCVPNHDQDAPQETREETPACNLTLQCIVVCCSVLQCVAASCVRIIIKSSNRKHAKKHRHVNYNIQVCCSVLQCVVVCCRVLQCVAARCVPNHNADAPQGNTRRNTGTCIIIFKCVAVCCSMLWCVAVCCSVLQCVAARCVPNHNQDATQGNTRGNTSTCSHIAVCCSVAQCVAVRCSKLCANHSQVIQHKTREETPARNL